MTLSDHVTSLRTYNNIFILNLSAAKYYLIVFEQLIGPISFFPLLCLHNTIEL